MIQGNLIIVGWIAITALLLLTSSSTQAFSPRSELRNQILFRTQIPFARSFDDEDDVINNIKQTTRTNPNTRRSFLQQTTTITTILGLTTTKTTLLPASAAISSEVKPGKPLFSCLYTILRVREATFQESRLIKTGKFKDVQRANVKLAVKFMIDNYRLSDNINAASAFIMDNTARVKASDLGLKAVQDLMTIVEYFDSADVENLKVGDSLIGKEKIVLQGLDSAKNSIDGFISYFPSDVVEGVKQRIADENALNVKEFDSNLGTILNPDPAAV